MGKATALQRLNNRWRATPEWYTPAWLLQRIADFYGGTYYDPCPASQGVVAESGLFGDWKGKRVYCNPPYGRGIEPWIIKAATDPAREVILLVPAYTDTKWFAPLFAYDLCFIKGRVYFEVMGKKGEHPAPHPSVLVYRGRRHRQFADAFSDLGPIMRTYRSKRDAQPHLLEVSAEPVA